jgi:hypothetical protein
VVPEVTLQSSRSGPVGASAIVGEADERGSSIVGVRGPTGEALVLQSIHELARRPDGDAEIVGDVLDAAASIAPVENPEGFQAREGHPEVSLEPRVKDIPKLGLVANQRIEEVDSLSAHRPLPSR